jgi:hypothetical protein
MSDTKDSLPAINSDEFAGRPGSFTFDPTTGKRARNAPVAAAPAVVPMVDPDQPVAAVTAESENQGHDQENT